MHYYPGVSFGVWLGAMADVLTIGGFIAFALLM
jgi:hypothetical protein